MPVTVLVEVTLPGLSETMLLYLLHYEMAARNLPTPVRALISAATDGTGGAGAAWRWSVYRLGLSIFRQRGRSARKANAVAVF